MNGKEDDDINNYFIETAFPSRQESSDVMAAIEKNNGASISDVIRSCNYRRTRITNAIAFLENEGFIHMQYDGRKRYYLTPRKYVYNEKHYEEIMAVRRRELEQMHDLIRTGECLSRFAVTALDDHSAGNCGKCSNCTGQDIFPGLSVSEASRIRATEFINSTMFEIEPRKQWPDAKKIKTQLMRGICLSKYGDPGYGEMVKRGKYPPAGQKKRFNDRLVKKAVEVLSNLIWKQGCREIYPFALADSSHGED